MDCFYFEEPCITGQTYLEILQTWLLSRLQAGEGDTYIFKQDGALPHWSLNVHKFLNTSLPNREIGCAGQDNNVFCILCPQKWLDLTVSDFFLVIYLRTKITYLPAPDHGWTAGTNQLIHPSDHTRYFAEILDETWLSLLHTPHDKRGTYAVRMTSFIFNFVNLCKRKYQNPVIMNSINHVIYIWNQGGFCGYPVLWFISKLKVNLNI